MGIEVRDLSKRFSGTVALDAITLDVRSGELLALLGPSGSGKTTLLRIIAGLERPEQGALLISGKPALSLPPRERGIGFVFQHYALFRHMTVADNIAFGLVVRPRATRPGGAAIGERVRELLSLVQLEGLGGRFPAQLSGGQRQRVALARALAVEPRVLLLDEPFGALDAKVRVELRHWLRGLHERLGLTTVFVTHDQEEALELADRVAILNAGRIEQTGLPREVYDRPASGFVMEFLGEVNRLPCRIAGGRARIGERGPRINAAQLPDGDAIAYVRPHEIELLPADAQTGCLARVRSLSVIGPRTRLHLEHESLVLEADADRQLVDALHLAPGQMVGIRLQNVRLFPGAKADARTA
jgi:sulfate/thiosulfate transport system ATP-binding protein